jgi:hypothetical protein
LKPLGTLLDSTKHLFQQILEHADWEWIAKQGLSFPQFALSMKMEDDIGGLLTSTPEELIDAETRKVLVEI